MANIGIMTKQQGILRGTVTTLKFTIADVVFKENDSDNPAAPKYRIGGRQDSKQRYAEIGAEWEKTSEQTGEVYLSGSIDDPSLPEPVYFAGFDMEGQDGVIQLVWTRTNPKKRKTAMDMNAADLGDSFDPSLDGLFNGEQDAA